MAQPPLTPDAVTRQARNRALLRPAAPAGNAGPVLPDPVLRVRLLNWQRPPSRSGKWSWNASGRWEARIGCIDPTALSEFSLSGEVVIGSRQDNRELPYSQANHERHFHATPWRREVMLQPVGRLTVHLSQVALLDEHGRFAIDKALFKPASPIREFDLKLLLIGPDDGAAPGTALRLASIVGARDLAEVCPLADDAEQSAEQADRAARLAAERFVSLGTPSQNSALPVPTNEMDEVNFLLEAIGLEVDGLGTMMMHPAWGAPDAWRWYAHHDFWNLAQSGAQTGIGWDAVALRQRLAQTRKRFYPQERPLPWAVFAGELRRFEEATPAAGLDRRVQLMRRCCHRPELIFDQVIGVAVGPRLEYDVDRVGGPLQFLKDHNRVDVGGRVVDLWHLAVGLETLTAQLRMPRPQWRFAVIKRTMGPAELEFPVDAERAAAATWAGDVGSALTDWLLDIDHIAPAGTGAAEPPSVLDHYWNSRVSAADLEGDILPWGLVAERAGLRPDMVRVSDWLLNHFSGGEASRREAYRAFIRHYADPQAPDRLDAAAVQREIAAFAGLWLMYRMSGNVSEDQKRRVGQLDQGPALADVTRRFIAHVMAQI